jgi:hypothetical protein
MPTSSPFRALVRGGAALALLALSSAASAQATPLPESISIGAWTFRPSLELRLRGEYRQAPFDTGGVTFVRTGVLDDAYGKNLPESLASPAARVENQWLTIERARVGLAVDRGPVTAALTLQDARLLAGNGGMFAPQATGTGFDLLEAYIDVHRTQRKLYGRIGRQRIVWGDGRLLGSSEFTQRPRTLDALRIGGSVGRFDLEAFAALIGVGPFGGAVAAAPGGGATGSTSTPAPIVANAGTQLYGARAVYRAAPLLAAELAALGRIVRDPARSDLVRGDTVVLDARLSGDRRGVRYAVEGAYELGRIASYGGNRSLGAFAGAARITWETSLPGHLTFGAEGTYASGDSGSSDPLAKQTRFDPILPDERPVHGRMGLVAWSNSIVAGGDIAARPADVLALDVGYRFVGLAEPHGRWSSASLVPIGASPTNTSRVLGHQIDATVALHVWEPLAIELGYGLFLTGEGAKNILEASGRGRPGAQHFGFLQAVVRAP